MISDIAKADKRFFILTYGEVMFGRAIAGIGYNFSGEAKASNGYKNNYFSFGFHACNKAMIEHLKEQEKEIRNEE